MRVPSSLSFGAGAPSPRSAGQQSEENAATLLASRAHPHEISALARQRIPYALEAEASEITFVDRGEIGGTVRE